MNIDQFCALLNAGAIEFRPGVWYVEGNLPAGMFSLSDSFGVIAENVNTARSTVTIFPMRKIERMDEVFEPKAVDHPPIERMGDTYKVEFDIEGGSVIVGLTRVSSARPGEWWSVAFATKSVDQFRYRVDDKSFATNQLLKIYNHVLFCVQKLADHVKATRMLFSSPESVGSDTTHSVKLTQVYQRFAQSRLFTDALDKMGWKVRRNPPNEVLLFRTLPKQDDLGESVKRQIKSMASQLVD